MHHWCMLGSHRLALAGVAAVLVAGAAVAGAAWVSSPSTGHLAARVEAQLHGARIVRVADVAPALVRALVATEDERFYRHHGIDVIGLMRAIPYDVVHGAFAQGASTITEQVAKLLYLNGNDHTPWRKLEDMALAVKLETRYSKSEILAAYLNTAYFGHGAYGVRAASERFFGVVPRRLSLAQASLLAGLPQAPSTYDPFAHPQAARGRQEEVLRSLVRVGALSATRAEGVLAAPLALRSGRALPAIAHADLRPGSALAWGDAAAGLLLVLVGGLLFAARRLVHGPVPARLGRSLGVLVVLFGAAVIVRSFRTL